MGRNRDPSCLGAFYVELNHYVAVELFGVGHQPAIELKVQLRIHLLVLLKPFQVLLVLLIARLWHFLVELSLLKNTPKLFFWLSVGVEKLAQGVRDRAAKALRSHSRQLIQVLNRNAQLGKEKPVDLGYPIADILCFLSSDLGTDHRLNSRSVPLKSSRSVPFVVELGLLDLPHHVVLVADLVVYNQLLFAIADMPCIFEGLLEKQDAGGMLGDSAAALPKSDQAVNQNGVVHLGDGAYARLVVVEDGFLVSAEGEQRPCQVEKSERELLDKFEVDAVIEEIDEVSC